MITEHKKYDFYALGNAMVDLYWQIADDFLADINLKKGTVLFLNDEQQTEVLARLPSCETKFAGGSVANSALTMKTLGASVFLSCHTATDSNGDFFEQSMRQAGVDISPRPPGTRPGAGTATCLILISQDAERSMCACLGVASELSTENIIPEVVTESDWVFIEGYQAASVSGTKASVLMLDLAKTHGTKRALTLSDPGLVSQFRAQVEAMLAQPLDLLFCNEAEALALVGTEDLATAMRRMNDYAESCVITLSEQGCLCYQKGQWHKVPTEATAAVDTTGAGDIFAGAFLYALKQGQDFVAAARFGNKAAGLVINQFGTRLHPRQYQDLRHF